MMRVLAATIGGVLLLTAVLFGVGDTTEADSTEPDKGIGTAITCQTLGKGDTND